LKYKEEYYSISHKGVLRGLHFQLPPAEHEKIVYCPFGRVLDAVVDLRKNSATYGEYALIELSGEKGNMLYIPKGMAHGFYTCSDQAIMMYKVTSMYSPEEDSGILWNSAGIPWPNENPILSNRDKNLKPFKFFMTPF
jgi:dTDP-4-dehydrorhamnose 3,5-epimerase